MSAVNACKKVSLELKHLNKDRTGNRSKDRATESSECREKCLLKQQKYTLQKPQNQTTEQKQNGREKQQKYSPPVRLNETVDCKKVRLAQKQKYNQ